MSNFDGEPILGIAKAVKSATAGDTFVQIPCGDKKIIFTRIYLVNASVDLSGTTSTLTIATKPGGSGTQIFPTSAGPFASLTSTEALLEIVGTGAVPVTRFTLTNSGVYVTIATVGGTAGTFDVYFQGIVL